MGAMDDDSMPVYAEVLQAQMGPKWDEITSRMRAWRCERCGLLYRHPYFDASELSKLFLDGTPMHKMGWRNLSGALQYGPRAGYCAPLQLWDELARRLGPIRSYAEFGCPFQGFVVARAATRQSRVRLRRRLLGSWRQPYLDREGGRSALAHALANRAQMPRGLRAPTGALQHIDVGRGSEATYVVMDSTMTRWGVGCVQYGNTCWQLGGQIEDVQVLGMRDLEESRGGARVSLLGFFDTLDHTYDLATTISWGFEIADAVLVVNHTSSEAARQHRIGLTHEALRYISESRPGWSWTDLADVQSLGLDEEHLWYLFTRDAAHQRT